MDETAPALIGSRCRTCGTYVFPPTLIACPNPDCSSTSAEIDATFETVELSRRGRIWSYTDARYEPPPPYVASDPYEPFCLAAVELVPRSWSCSVRSPRGSPSTISTSAWRSSSCSEN